MEAAGIYLVLSSIGMPGRFHWGLYLKLSRNLGFVAHAQHPDWSLSSLDWEMEYTQKATLESSVNLILALKVGTLQTSKYSSYERNLREPALMNESESSDFSCRIWVKRALKQLHEEGFVECDDVDAVEAEAIEFGTDSEREFRGRRGFLIKSSRYSS